MTEIPKNSPKFTLEQENYIDWLAQPPSIKIPKTRTEYAEQVGRDRKTLYNWEQISGFDEERRNRIKRWQKESTPEIIERLKEKALSGDTTATRIWLEWVEGMDSKIRLEHTSKEPMIIKFVDYEEWKRLNSNENKA